MGRGDLMPASSAFSSRKKKITYLRFSHNLYGSYDLSNLAIKFIIAIPGLFAVREITILSSSFDYLLTIMIQVVLSGG
jgi:hypothetical protein